MILYPRILLPRMCSASAAEIVSNRRNAVVAGRGNDPDRKGTISKLHGFCRAQFADGSRIRRNGRRAPRGTFGPHPLRIC
jgi:hypothetical protein